MPTAKKTPTKGESKKPTSGGSKKPGSGKGEPVINTDILCDETWKCDVVFLFEGDKEGCSVVNLLQQIPAKQFVGSVKVINKNDILKDVKKSGGKGSKKGTPKSQKGKEQEVELTDEQKIVKCIKENTEIPGKPLATIIFKYLIKLKVEDINDRRKMLSAASKQKKPESKGKKKGTKEATSDSEKQNTVVERPPLFVVLLGFSEYDLPVELIKQNIPIRAVVKLIVAVTTTETGNDIEPHTHLPDLSSENFNMPWLNFWRKYEKFMYISENADCGNDLATIPYRLQEELISEKVNLKDRKNNAINQLTNLMDYVRYLLARHESYSNSVTITNISEELTNEAPDVYNTLIQMVPLECVSIPLILFSLIEQICLWHGDEIDIANIADKDNNSKKPDLHSKKFMSIKCSPAIIRHNDEHSLRTFHLEIPEVDFNKIVIRFLSTLFLLNPWQNKKLDQMQKCFFEFHLQRLWKLAFKNIHLKLFYIYLHFYILCRMKSYYKSILRNSRKDNNGIMIDESTGLPHDFSRNNEFFQEWLKEIETIEQITSSLNSISDDSYNDLLQIKSVNNLTVKSVCNNNNDNESNNIRHNRGDSQPTAHSNKPEAQSKSKTVDNIKKYRHRSLKIMKKFLCCSEILCLIEHNEPLMMLRNLKAFTNYKYIEQMGPLSLLQSLQEALLNYSQIHSVYYYPSNCVLLWFHNAKDFIFEENKTGNIDTIYGFRDYYTNIIEPEENSLLQQGIVLNKTTLETNYQNANDTNNSIREADKQVNIYDMGKKMVQFSQCNRTFSSQDGCNLTVKTEDWYRSSQFVNIFINKIDTEMIIHLDKLSFMKDSIDKNYSPTVKAPVETMKLLLRLPNETLITARVEEKSTEEIPAGENSTELTSTQFIFSDLTVTVPTGLIIQVINNQYDNNNLYIKQSYSAKGPNCSRIWDEKCRCFDRSGTVLIFRSDGIIDVVYGSTALGKVGKVEESVIERKEEVIEVPKEEPKKEKKTKGKGKSKKAESETIPKIEPIELQEQKTPTLPYKITDHSIQSWSGIVYSYNEKSCIKIVDNNINLRTVFNPFSQLYMDRNDGIKCLYTDDGKLVSTYEDGTMLTLYVYEEPNTTTNTLAKSNEEQDKQISEDFQLSETASNHETTSFDRGSFHSFNSSSFFKSEGEEELSNETFVSYKLGCIAEHSNYAKVEFVPSNDSIQLVLADDLMISIYNVQENGSYEFTVNVKKTADIKFTTESICFTSNIIKEAKNVNITTVSPVSSSDTSTEYATYFCKTTDSFGRLFLVNKYGNVKLEEPEAEGFVNFSYSKPDTRRTEFYYESNILRKLTERFFVVNSDFSGYEAIAQSDVPLLDKEDENRFKFVDVIKNPRSDNVSSKTNQYCMYQSHSDGYLLESEFNDIIPASFHRIDLTKAWMCSHSPWFFNRSNFKKYEYKQSSYTEISKRNKRMQAVVVKTIQQVTGSSSVTGLEVILSCLEKYRKENKEFCDKYKQQGYTDLDGDLKLNENHQLISSIKKEIPLWNVLRKECNVCRQTFGSPARCSSSTLLDIKDTCTGPEKLVERIDYLNPETSSQ